MFSIIEVVQTETVLRLRSDVDYRSQEQRDAWEQKQFDISVKRREQARKEKTQ